MCATGGYRKGLLPAIRCGVTGVQGLKIFFQSTQCTSWQFLLHDLAQSSGLNNTTTWKQPPTTNGNVCSRHQRFPLVLASSPSHPSPRSSPLPRHHDPRTPAADGANCITLPHAASTGTGLRRRQRFTHTPDGGLERGRRRRRLWVTASATPRLLAYTWNWPIRHRRPRGGRGPILFAKSGCEGGLILIAAPSQQQEGAF